MTPSQSSSNGSVRDELTRPIGSMVTCASVSERRWVRHQLGPLRRPWAAGRGVRANSRDTRAEAWKSDMHSRRTPVPHGRLTPTSDGVPTASLCCLLYTSDAADDLLCV